MQFTDAVTVAGTRRRDDGYLVADARIARTGIQTYLGSEVGMPDKATVRVYRPGSEVFHADTLKSAAHRPVTNDHPPELVNSSNWKDYAVGQTGDEVQGESIFIRVPLMVSDEAAIKDIENGKRELSAGYTCDLDFTPGQTPSGEAYDAIQKNIRLNHVAIVQAGRAGSQVRIGDGAVQWGASPVITPTADTKGSPMADNLRKVLVDGLQVETTDAGAAAIDKLTADKAAVQKKLDDATADHAKAIAAKDAEIAKKDAEIDGLKGKVLDAAAIDKLVAARADLIGKAKVLAKDVKTDGLSDAEIKKAVVLAVVGDAAKDKPEAYIDARFEILVEDAQKKAGDKDPFREVVSDGLTPTADELKPVNDARAQMLKDLQSGNVSAKAN
jgi:hypothetical protein